MSKFDRMKALRGLYGLHMADIMADGCEWGLDAYAWSEYVSLSPIEQIMWDEIRCNNLVLYPQFPVGLYYVDFGNPVAKVAIECDGAEFHTNAERDEKRQASIESQGWTVYRITGSAVMKQERTEQDECGRDVLTPSPVSLLLDRIKRAHRISREQRQASERNGTCFASVVLNQLAKAEAGHRAEVDSNA